MFCSVLRCRQFNPCSQTSAIVWRFYNARYFHNTPGFARFAQQQPISNGSSSYFKYRNMHTTGLARGHDKKPFHQRYSRGIKVTCTVIAVVAGYSIYSEFKKQTEPHQNVIDLVNPAESVFLKGKPPTHQISRSIVNPKDGSALKLTLYQYQTCPFCCKVRAFLDYHGFSYDVVEVNSVTRTQTKWTSYRKVPFLVVEVPGTEYGESTLLQLKDSSVIISILTSVLRNPKESLLNILEAYPSYYTEDKKVEFANRFNIMYGENSEAVQQTKQIQLERKWRQWVDDVFVHTLSPNVYRTPTEAMQAFTWFSEVGEWKKVFPTWERLLVIYTGSAVMWIIGKRLKKKYKLTDNPRLSLYEEGTQWTHAVDMSEGEFLGGKEPNMADVSMYGVLTAIEGCDAFQDLLNNTKIDKWYSQMKKAVIAKDGEQILVNRCAIR